MQSIWVDPADIARTTLYQKERVGLLIEGYDVLPFSSFRSRIECFVSDGDWDLHTAPIMSHQIIARTFRRYSLGMSWEDTGEVEWMERNIKEFGAIDGCYSLSDIRRRCARLDEIYASLKNGGELQKSTQLQRFNFRGENDIGIGIDRNANLIWIGNGGHRLAMANVLGIKRVPASVTLIHNLALKDFHRKYSSGDAT
jgi:hypothetical protein